MSATATTKQLQEIKEIRDKVGHEHLIDALYRIGIFNKRNKEKTITVSMMESLTRGQAHTVIKLLNLVRKGKVKWLRVKGITGRYPNRLMRDRRSEGEAFVYFVSDNIGHIKIGKAVDVENRLKGLQTGNPYVLEIKAVVAGSYRVESRLHYMFKKYNTVGDWFEFNDVIKDFMLSMGDNGYDVIVPYSSHSR